MTRDKIDNLECLGQYLSKAIDYMNSIEESWEEGAFTEEQENTVLDLIDTMEGLQGDIEERIYELNEIDELENPGEEV